MESVRHWPSADSIYSDIQVERGGRSSTYTYNTPLLPPEVYCYYNFNAKSICAGSDF